MEEDVKPGKYELFMLKQVFPIPEKGFFLKIGKKIKVSLGEDHSQRSSH